MKLHAVLAFALAACALVFGLSVTAATPDALTPTVEIQEATAPSCSLSAELDETRLFTPLQKATGCSESVCDRSCRQQGYDYGVCFGQECICRFWYP